MDVSTTASMEVVETSPNSSSTSNIHMVGAGCALLFLGLVAFIGNILVLIALGRLRKSNHKVKSIHVIIGMFACVEISFATVSVGLSSAAFLTTWRLDNFAVWCNFAGWVSFFSKTSCASITVLFIMERYLDVCISRSQSSKLKHIVKSQIYWAIRAAILASILATVPLFYGDDMVSDEYTGGNYCHFDYSSLSTQSYIYTLILCVSGFISLQYVLFCFVSILCHTGQSTHRGDDTYEEELIHSNSVSSNQHDRYFIGTTTPTRQGNRLVSAETPSRYALDSPSFFETMQNDVATRRKHRTRMILAVIVWYWACLLPYMIVMTLSVAGNTISGSTDFAVFLGIAVNSAVTPYLIIGLYPPYWSHVKNVLTRNSDKRLEPPPTVKSNPDELPHSLSVAYDETSLAAQSLHKARYQNRHHSSPYPSGNHGGSYRNYHTDANTMELKNCSLSSKLPNGLMMGEPHQGKTQMGYQVQTQPDIIVAKEPGGGPSSYNAGYMSDTQIIDGDPGKHSGSDSYTEDGDCTESECSACDLDENYPPPLFYMPDHMYYPSRMSIYDTSHSLPTSGQVIYRQDPNDHRVIYAVNTSMEDMSKPVIDGRILGRAELRKMSSKTGKTPANIYTRNDIPCETSLYAHNYRAPSFLKQYQGRPGWKEAVEIERRIDMRNIQVAASEGDGQSQRGSDEFERRNTWNGGLNQNEAAVGRKASYRLAMNDEDFLSLEYQASLYPPQRNELSLSKVMERPHLPLVEQDLVLQNVQVASDPLLMNMAFQKTIFHESTVVDSMADHKKSDIVGKNEPLPVHILETDSNTESVTDERHGETPATEDSHRPNMTQLEESSDVEADADGNSFSSDESHVSYRQYVRTINSIPNSPNKVPCIEISPPMKSSEDSDSDTDSDHFVESLMQSFTMGIGKLPVPSFKKAKNMEDKKQKKEALEKFENDIQVDLAETLTTKQKVTDMVDGYNSENRDDFAKDYNDDYSDEIIELTVDWGEELRLVDDLTAEFDREMARRTIVNNPKVHPDIHDNPDSRKSLDRQSITDQIRMAVEHVVEDHLNDDHMISEVKSKEETLDHKSQKQLVSDSTNSTVEGELNMPSKTPCMAAIFKNQFDLDKPQDDIDETESFKVTESDKAINLSPSYTKKIGDDKTNLDASCDISTVTESNTDTPFEDAEVEETNQEMSGDDKIDDYDYCLVPQGIQYRETDLDDILCDAIVIDESHEEPQVRSKSEMGTISHKISSVKSDTNLHSAGSLQVDQDLQEIRNEVPQDLNIQARNHDPGIQYHKNQNEHSNIHSEKREPAKLNHIQELQNQPPKDLDPSQDSTNPKSKNSDPKKDTKSRNQNKEASPNHKVIPNLEDTVQEPSTDDITNTQQSEYTETDGLQHNGVGTQTSVNDDPNETVTLVVECESNSDPDDPSPRMTYVVKSKGSKQVPTTTTNKHNGGQITGTEQFSLNKNILEGSNPSTEQEAEHTSALLETGGNHTDAYGNNAEVGMGDNWILQEAGSIPNDANTSSTLQAIDQSEFNSTLHPQNALVENDNTDEHRSSKSPPLWNRYRNVILKVSKTKKKSPENCKDDLNKRDARSLIQVNAPHQDMGRNSTVVGEEKVPSESNDEQTPLALPGVAPRKQSPRSLWKKYRRDMLKVSQIDFDDSNPVDKQNSNTLPKDVSETKTNRRLHMDTTPVQNDQSAKLPIGLMHNKQHIEGSPDLCNDITDSMGKCSENIPKPSADCKSTDMTCKQSQLGNNNTRTKPSIPIPSTTEKDMWKTIEQRSPGYRYPNDSSVVDGPCLLTNILLGGTVSKPQQLPPKRVAINGINGGCESNTNASLKDVKNTKDLAFHENVDTTAGDVKDNEVNCDNEAIKSKHNEDLNSNHKPLVDTDIDSTSQIDYQSVDDELQANMIQIERDLDSSSPKSYQSSDESLDDLINISRCINVYDLDTSNHESELSVSLKRSLSRKNSSLRRHSTDGSDFPHPRGNAIDMSVCSGNSNTLQDMSVCSGELGSPEMTSVLSGKHVSPQIRQRRGSSPGNLVLRDIVLDASEIQI